MAGKLLVSIPIVLAGLGLGRIFRGGSHAEELAAMLQLFFAIAIAQEAVIANAMESVGENVEQESPNELLGGEGHDLLLMVVAIVPPLELDLPVFDIYDALIGNRDPMGVAADVVHYLLGAGEGCFGVDDPFFVAEGAR
jgi:hypothetical protein